MTVEERLARAERELARVRRRNRWLVAALALEDEKRIRAVLQMKEEGA